jgi:hypothetical protein
MVVRYVFSAFCILCGLVVRLHGDTFHIFLYRVNGYPDGFGFRVANVKRGSAVAGYFTVSEEMPVITRRIGDTEPFVAEPKSVSFCMEGRLFIIGSNRHLSLWGCCSADRFYIQAADAQPFSFNRKNVAGQVFYVPTNSSEMESDNKNYFEVVGDGECFIKNETIQKKNKRGACCGVF